MAESHAIAVVDDDSNLLEIFDAALSSAGWEISCFSSAEIAQGRISRQRFSALLTDALPGYEDVIATFKSQNPHAPAIVLTGSLLPEQEERARSAGADLVLYKPIGIAALKENLQNLISAVVQRSALSSHVGPEVKAVLDAESRLVNAWLATDVETLDDLLGEEYQFVAADRAESKRHRLQALRSGRLRYTVARPRDREAKYYGDVCVVTSIIEIAGEREGREFGGLYRSVRIYRRSNQRWRAVAGQLIQFRHLEGCADGAAQD